MDKARCHICAIDLEDERLDPTLEYTCIFCWKQPQLEAEAEALLAAMENGRKVEKA